ncbi:MAG: hypothetical protein V1845_00885 [bacterium]
MSKHNAVYFVFIGIIIIFSLFAWHNLRDLLYDPGEGNIIATLAVFLLLTGLMGALIVLFNSLGLLVLASAISFGLFIPTFPFKPVYLLALAVAVAIMAAGLQHAIREKNIHLRIQALDIAKPALAMFFTALAVIVSVTLYFSPPAQGLSVEIKIPRPLFDIVLKATIGFFSSEQSGQSNQIAFSPLGISGLPEISPQDINRALGGGSLEMDKVFTQETKDGLYKTMNEQINFFVRSYKRYLPLGFAIALFLSLKAVSFIFVGLSVLLSHLIFTLMKGLKFVTIRKEMAEKEIIEI